LTPTHKGQEIVISSFVNHATTTSEDLDGMQRL